LLAQNEFQARHESFFPNPRDYEEMQMMQKPLDGSKAYGRFGLLLGLFPPAAIFVRLCGYGFGLFSVREDSLPIFLCCLALNIICAFSGCFIASRMSSSILRVERRSWIRMALLSPMIGLAWAIITGGIGGILVLGIGALFGAAFAIPVGMLAFPLFIFLHRLVAPAGVIEARHFWPLATGVTMLTVALILSPNVFGY
jgi:hypothetical protein